MRFGFMNVILLHIDHRHVLVTHVAIFIFIFIYSVFQRSTKVDIELVIR